MKRFDGDFKDERMILTTKSELSAKLEYFNMVHGVTLRAIAALDDKGLEFPTGNPRWEPPMSSSEVLHLRQRGRDPSFVDVVACLSPRRNLNTHACPCTFCWVIPRACPFRIMFAASIP